MKRLTIDNYVPNDVCKQMCELFDESDELEERGFYQGKDFFAITINCKDMFKSHKGKQWQIATTKFAKAMNSAYEKWCKEFEEEKVNTTLEVPKIHRYDPVFGKQNSTNYDDKRILACFFYLTSHNGKIKFEDKTIKPKKGQLICFPPNEKHAFQESSDSHYMKYVLKGYLIKK